jgi:hypothetical protein
MRSRTIPVAILAAAALGVSLAAAADWKPPVAGSWQCFRADRFPDPERDPSRAPAWEPARAADDKGAREFAAGLNVVARASPVGAALSTQLNQALGAPYSVICVKY